MTDQSSNATPDALLSDAADLRRVVRSAQRATWFPLAVFAVLTLLALPVVRSAHRTETCSGSGHPPLGTRVCSVYTSASFVYWPIALIVGYAVIVAFYRWRAQRVGVGSRIQPYVIAGVALAVVLTAVAIYHAHNPGDVNNLFGIRLSPNSAMFRVENRLVTPEAAIGIGLLILAWVERSVLLLAFTIVYLVVLASGARFGWSPSLRSSASMDPRIVIPGLLLAAGAALFALYERRGLRR